MSTLVVLVGNARGGEETWDSMYRHLLDVYEADLALMFGQTSNRQSSLYRKARFVWEVPEYADWRDYYTPALDGENWYRSFMRGVSNGFAGGLRKFKGSGAIVFAFRHRLKHQHLNILQQYDRIVLTRSDHYYIQDHPILPNDAIWVVEGEDYGGICDRHHVFPSILAGEVLGVVEFLNTDGVPESLPLRVNPEQALKLSWQRDGIWPKVRRSPRVQFTVWAEGDSTRWRRPRALMPGSSTLRLKYEGEYELAMENLRKGIT